MRQIKFRGKRLDYGKWIYGDLVHLVDDEVGIAFKLSDLGFNPVDKVDPNTVGEYTGLKDRNGREIYEGDIISPSNGLFLDDYSCVEWEDGSYTFDDGYPLGHIQAMEHTIVGNIHDNPDLAN